MSGSVNAKTNGRPKDFVVIKATARKLARGRNFGANRSPRSEARSFRVTLIKPQLLRNQDSEGGDDEREAALSSFPSSESSLPGTDPSVLPSSLFSYDLALSPTSTLSSSLFDSSLALSRSLRWLDRLTCGPGVKSGERSGFEKDSGAVNGNAGTGNVKCEGDRDGRADEPGKALRSGAEDGGPSLPLSPLALPDEPLLLMG